MSLEQYSKQLDTDGVVIIPNVLHQNKLKI